MTITKTDIKLKESERLTDTDDGGGRMTAIEVVDGQVNNLFNDISRLDRTIGRVSMRKAFVAVDTAQQDVYAGAHLIVTNPPGDPGVHTTIFTTNDDGDERTAAQERVESYTISGPVSRMRLYDRHVAGQRTLQILQFPSDPLPEVGEVYSLAKGEGTINFQEQFFRIQKLTEDLMTFVSSQAGTYQLRVLNITIDVTLDHNFEGYIPEYSDDRFDAQYASDDENRPMIRQTSVADAARYYGVKPITVPIVENDLSIEIESILSPLVPSTQAESPIVDVAANEPSGRDFDIPISLDKSMGNIIPAGTVFNVGWPVVPGSVTLTYTAGGVVVDTYIDDGAGTLVNQSGGENNVDYKSGVITIAGDYGGDSLVVNVIATRLVEIFESSNSKQIPITIQNRQLSYTDFLRPIPHPNTLSVSYRSLGKWYRLTDDGLGSLVPDVASTGAGSINYVTGSVAVTLPFEPDADSSIIFQWGTASNYSDRSGDLVPIQPGAILRTIKPGVVPNSLTVSWVSGGVNKSVTDDGMGALSGDGTGGVVYSIGMIYVEPDDYPDANAEYVINYDNGIEVEEIFTPTKDGNGFISITLAQQPIVPGSVRVNWSTIRDAFISEKIG